jgi:hypothetical protein
MNRRTLLQSLASAAVLPAALDAAAAQEITPATVYELRIYHLNPGKLPLILNRMRTKETQIFARLGMHLVGFWTPTDDPLAGNTLTYILRHKSREAATEAWAKFKVDPEWVTVKTESEKDGAFMLKAESTFMQLTDFSPKI